MTLALLQAQLNLMADTTPVISPSTGGGWEATLTVTLQITQPTAQEQLSATTVRSPLLDEASPRADEDYEVSFVHMDMGSDEDVLEGLASETKNNRKSITSTARFINLVLEKLEGKAALGLRRGKLLLSQLENLVLAQQRVLIYQAVVTKNVISATALKALAHETAVAGEIARRHVERFSNQLARERSLRGQARTDVIALAEQLRDEVKALAEAVGKLTVTDVAIARAVWEAWFQLEEVEIWNLELPGDNANPREERKPLPRPYDGLVAAISLNGSEKRHLTDGRFDTLCGRSIEGDWDEEKAFRRTDCKRCRQIARKRFLVCYSCEKPLLKEEESGLCPSCSRQEREWSGDSIYDPIPKPRRSSRRKGSINGMGALFMLDQALAQERALEQQYNLPFRAPLQTAGVLHRCERCEEPLLFLIFGDRAVDAAGLDAYGRLMQKYIREHGVPAYVLGKADGPGDDAISLLRRVWSDQGEVTTMTANRWEQFLEDFSQSHTCRHAPTS